MLHIGEFVVSVFSHWVALMSGLASVLVAIWLQAKKRQAVSSRIFWIIGLACLILAFYLAWVDQHRQVVELERRLAAPDFKLEGTSEWFGDDGKDLRMAIAGLLTNPLGPASAAIGWQVSLEFPNRMVMGEIALSPNKDVVVPITGNTTNTLVLRANECWLARAGEVIQAGGGSQGWLSVTFRNTLANDLYASKPTLMVSCLDVVARKRHVFSVALGHGKPGVTIPAK